MNITFLRHGKTQGNVEHRYAGSTDGPLCEAGRRTLAALAARGIYPPVEHIYVSPLLRCLQTRELLYPQVPFTVLEALREQNYGDFENKTYAELEQNPVFRAWISSSGASGAPNGEQQTAFFARCAAALNTVCGDACRKKCGEVAVVTHGGVIMALLSRYAAPPRTFYEWHCGNGRGFRLAVHEAAGKNPLELLETIDCEGLL